MVELPEGFCIDATEVTRAQYEEWLSKNPSTSEQPSSCSWNTSFEPEATCMQYPEVCSTGCDEHPQVCVDWCDANAYCAAVGKRLCGNIGGGASTTVDDATTSQWYAACSSGGSADYGYGDTISSTACRASGMGYSTTYPVGTMTGCQSGTAGYGEVYDLSGNVLEWEDSCEGTDEMTDYCDVRGGSFVYPPVNLRCDFIEVFAVRSTKRGDLGFRCCSID